MTFLDASQRLLAHVRNEVHNGELTERGLARLIGISQPHAHNVLKGVRTLSPEVADLILKYLHISLLDLAPENEMDAQRERRRSRERLPEVPFLTAPIGPGLPWLDEVNWRKSHPLPISSTIVLTDLVMAKLLADPFYDIALLDISERCVSTLSPEALYAIERGGETVLRYIRPGAHCYYLATNAGLDHPSAWEPLQLCKSQLRAAIKARVLWLGHQAEGDAPPHRDRLLEKTIAS